MNHDELMRQLSRSSYIDAGLYGGALDLPTRREEVASKPPTPFAERARVIADTIEDARVDLQRLRLRVRIAATVATVGVSSVVGGLILGGFAATFNLGVAPLVAAAIIAGLVLAVLGVAGVAISHDQTDSREHPADVLRRAERRQRDLYLEQADGQ